MGMESQPGRGSVFWFMLPLEGAPAPEPVSPAPTVEEADLPPQLKHGHVLVVDDNPIDQLVAAHAVSRLRHLAEAFPAASRHRKRLRKESSTPCFWTVKCLEWMAIKAPRISEPRGARPAHPYYRLDGKHGRSGCAEMPV